VIGTPPPSVVVGSFAFLGFDGFVAVVVGVDAVPAGSTAGAGVAPPVDGAGVDVGADALTAGAEGAVCVAAAAVVVVAFLAAGLCLAWCALCVALAFGAVVGVLVAAAGPALGVDLVEPPLPQPAVTMAAVATVQSTARFICRLPLCVEGQVFGLQTHVRLQRFAADAHTRIALGASVDSPRAPRLRVRGTIAGEESWTRR
jgi:hypothetical protein